MAGERGIGKSSLVSFVRHLTEREERVAGAHVFLGGVESPGEMVRRTFDRLLKDSVEKAWHQKIRDLFGRYVREVGLFGISIELEMPPSDLQALVHGFAAHLRKLLAQLKEERKALLLILDDINGLAGSAEFANWLKSVVDEVATSGNSASVCLLMVGVEERRQQLIRLQPSLARVFELVEIKPWSNEETRDFFRRAFEGSGVKVEPRALEVMVKFSGGLPVLAHEIGDAVWRLLSERMVQEPDAWRGVLDAAEIIGKKLLEPQVLRAVRSPRYRSILRKLAARLVTSFRRADLLKALSAEEKKVCDNFLNRMRKLNVIISDREGGPGAYRFSNQLHALYFSMEAHRPREQKAP
ncbi:MAG: AAA family ATPase [Verrucomicrobiales bacterium]|nr:AAA family ATPase [Verrucomicrobiales bacterium]